MEMGEQEVETGTRDGSKDDVNYSPRKYIDSSQNGEHVTQEKENGRVRVERTEVII